MSRQTPMSANGDLDLFAEAELAARGNSGALDRLFGALGGSAWGIGFSAADAVGPATDAVAKGFAELLQLFDNGLAVGDVRTELLRFTRTAAIEAPKVPDSQTSEEAIHAGREPLSLLGETKDRQATLAFTALSEQMRSALWLSEAEGFSITKASQLLGEPHKATENLVRQARASFRAYYVDAVKRDGLDEVCLNTLDRLAAYVGRSLPAGEVAKVEHHLAECKDCRAIVMKLDDLEGRLHAAIPSLPAWTRQQVADEWATFATPRAAVEIDREPIDHQPSRLPFKALAALIGIAAVLIVGAGAGVLDSSPKSKTQQAVSIPSNNDAVDTPKAPSTTVTTVDDVPSTTAVTSPPPTTSEPPTTQSQTPAEPSTVHRITETSIAPTTTTNPQSGYTLVNLPPTPITH